MTRTSEFWAALLVLILQSGVGAGWWTYDDVSRVLEFCIGYSAARVTSKVAKAVPSLPKKEGA